MENNLGSILKERRLIMGLTLRQVEESVGQSNAYLSMLENGKIKKPSANTLYKLSCIYNLPLDILLRAAGIITKSQNLKFDETANKLNGIELTDEELKQLLSYLRFLRNGK